MLTDGFTAFVFTLEVGESLDFILFLRDCDSFSLDEIISEDCELSIPSSTAVGRSLSPEAYEASTEKTFLFSSRSLGTVPSLSKF